MKVCCVSAALIIFSSFPSIGNAQQNFPRAEVKPQYRMTITSVRSKTVSVKGTPVTPIENRSLMEIDITIEVKPSIPGASVPVVPAWICVVDRSGECDRRIATVELRAGTWPVVATAAAPTAGKHARFRLNLCQGNPSGEVGATCNKVLTNTESDPFPVAAIYSLRLKEVAIDQVRAPNKDTVLSTIVGAPYVNDASCTTRCTQAFLSVESRNGDHISKGLPGVVGGMQIGPFMRTPAQDGDIWISYALINLGARYDDDDEKNLTRKKALKVQALNYVKAGLAFRTESDYPSTELNSSNFRWAGCDGPLIGRVFTLPNTGSGDTIFTWTEGTGQRELDFVADKSPALIVSGDGCHQPQYHVKWLLIRDSWHN